MARYIRLDIETTGDDEDHDEITEIACGSCCIEKTSDENGVRNRTEECEMSHAHGITSFCPQIDAPQMNAPPPASPTGLSSDTLIPDEIMQQVLQGAFPAPEYAIRSFLNEEHCTVFEVTAPILDRHNDLLQFFVLSDTNHQWFCIADDFTEPDFPLEPPQRTIHDLNEIPVACNLVLAAMKEYVEQIENFNKSFLVNDPDFGA